MTSVHAYNMLQAARSSLPYLSIDELDDIGVAAQPLQQRDLVDEACSRLAIPSGQPNALQRIYLAVGRHDFVHLCMFYTVTLRPFCPFTKPSTYSTEPNDICERVRWK